MPVPIPPSFDVVEVHGKFVAFDGRPLRGSVTFAPSVRHLIAPDDNTVILARPIVGKVVDGELRDAEGVGPLRLFATDDPDVSAQGWTYQVTETFGNDAGRAAYSISVPRSAAPAGLDLSSVAPVDPAPSSGVSYVLLPAFSLLAERVAALEAATSTGSGLTEEQVVALLAPYIDPSELTAVLASYATDGDLAAALTVYATDTEVTQAIAAAIAALPVVDLSPYLTASQAASTYLSTTQAASTYATAAGVSTTYATKTSVTNQIAAAAPDLTPFVDSSSIDSIVSLSQASYDALSPKNDRTLYVIV